MRLLIQHGTMFLFWCPGCKNGHPYHTSGPSAWQWNGSMVSPTFTPSLLVNHGQGQNRCHLFVTNGKIQFCADCSHSLAGQTVPMVDWDTIIGEEKMDNENAPQTAPAPTPALSGTGPANQVAQPGPVIPPPQPDFDQAVTHLLMGEAAATATPFVPPATTVAPAEEEKVLVTSADMNKPPEPGMKRCPQCGIWYPGGYDTCPHDGARL